MTNTLSSAHELCLSKISEHFFCCTKLELVGGMRAEGTVSCLTNEIVLRSQCLFSVLVTLPFAKQHPPDAVCNCGVALGD